MINLQSEIANCYNRNTCVHWNGIWGAFIVLNMISF